MSREISTPIEGKSTDNRAFGVYLSICGFVLLVIGILVAYLSVNMVQSNDSALAGSSITLLLGALIAVVGATALLIGFFSGKRRPYIYY